MRSIHLDLQIGPLVRQLQQGDFSGQASLIEYVQTPLLKFCLCLTRNQEIAEDLCQEVLVKALQNISSLQTPEKFIGWTYQISRNLFIDFKRSPENQHKLSEDHLHALGFDSKADLILGVQETLDQFSDEDRVLLLLIELEGYSYKETANVLQISEDAVRSKLHRLRSAFMKIHSTNAA
jgi:RNA polymerase sigma-70 factor (ECF subfamily)